MIDRAIQRNSTHTQDDASQSSGGGLRRPVQPARVCSYTDFMKCQPVNFKGTKALLDCLNGSKRLSEIKKLEIERWNPRVKGNDVAAYTQCFQKLALMCTKFFADETEKVDKYIARAYTAGSGEKKVYTGAYLCAPSEITSTLGNEHPSVENARGHIKKNCLKLKNRGNGSGNGVAQGRVYALGGRDVSPISNVIT
nr:reverse transcriptase domain-containing protein [Tanacetum cinerariifolium]